MSDMDTRSYAKWMNILAWLAALLLLSLGFNHLLQKRYNPNQQPQAYRQGSDISVRLKANPQGHYVVSGRINNQPVTFLLDTGATDVSVPYKLAEKLGLKAGYQQQVSTANGRITVYNTRIHQLTIGAITLNNINATLNPAMDSDEILLGMSALRKLDFHQQGGTLILKQRTEN